MKSKLTFFFYTIGLSLFLIIACNDPYAIAFRNFYYSENELIHSKNSKDHHYLKAHDYHGQVYIFNKDWNLDTTSLIISGKGKFYSAERDLLQSGDLNVHVDSIVIFETNRSLGDVVSPFIAPKVILSIGNVLLAGFCLSVPKACFGSCPTFYAKENRNDVFLTNAEGFSNAIAPSMEYTDIDALGIISEKCTPFPIFMKNEALETHAVKSVDVLAVPCNAGEDICHGTDNKFYSTGHHISTQTVIFEGEDITSILECNDGLEWTSLADNDKLVTKGEMIMEFDPVELSTNENIGLKLTFRQTLMTTYMLYHAISYMGDEYSDILSKMETRKELGGDISKKFFDALGGIEVYLMESSNNTNKWVYQGRFYETGPIAKNTQICAFQMENLQTGSKKFKVKLVFNKGLWRLEEAQLLTINKEVYPILLKPHNVKKNSELSSNSLRYLSDPNKHLVSLPGDEFEISYLIPCEEDQYKLFLSSRGYYLEWMRYHWLADKNLFALKKMLKDPVRWLNNETKKFKMYEIQMEHDFYNSRIEKNQRHLLLELSL